MSQGDKRHKDHMSALIHRIVSLAIAGSSLVSCTSAPANWADALSERAYCGMPIDEIEKVVARRVVEQKSENNTHFIRDEGGTTAVSLAIENNRLQRIEIAWTSKAIAVVPEQIKTIDLCNARKTETKSAYAQPRAK
jgi:hypothetical protein